MIDVAKILELLETTPPHKLKTAKKEFAPISISATESANDILNRELGLTEGQPKGAARLPFKKKAVEETKLDIKTPETAFPELINFDEEAFANEYGIDVETITAAYVEMSEDGKIPEHLEISFEFEGSKVILAVYADGEVKETVDGEFIEPAQFRGRFEEEETEDGIVETFLYLDLLDGEEEEDTYEADNEGPIKSEGDEEHFDEDGQATSDEFIEEAGLGEDEYYAKSHSLEVSKNPANRIDPEKGTARANESLAARTARAYRR